MRGRFLIGLMPMKTGPSATVSTIRRVCTGFFMRLRKRLGCFIATLARFRVDVSFVADLALMENGEDDFTAFGTVRSAWIVIILLSKNP